MLYFERLLFEKQQYVKVYIFSISQNDPIPTGKTKNPWKYMEIFLTSVYIYSLLYKPF